MFYYEQHDMFRLMYNKNDINNMFILKRYYPNYHLSLQQNIKNYIANLTQSWYTYTKLLTMKTLALELSALMIILLSTGPVLLISSHTTGNFHTMFVLIYSLDSIVNFISCYS